MTRRVLLVRHAMPTPDPSSDPARWPLSPEGREAADTLCSRLPADAVLVASDELKAQQTLQPAGAVRVDPRLGEVRRKEPFAGDFRERRLAYVSGRLDDRHVGWERPADVATRFEAVVRESLRESVTPVLGTHGMALTVWLTALGRLDDPGAFWSRLGFPEVVSVDLAV